MYSRMVRNHKCSSCDRLYTCFCYKQHPRGGPSFDCGLCVKGQETVDSIALQQRFYSGRVTDRVNPKLRDAHASNPKHYRKRR